MDPYSWKRTYYAAWLKWAGSRVGYTLKWGGSWMAYILYWVGVWIAFAAMCLFPIAWLSGGRVFDLPGWLQAAVFIAAPTVILVVKVRQASSAKETPLTGQARRARAGESLREESAPSSNGAAAFIGLFCGPVLYLLTFFAAGSLYEPPGYDSHSFQTASTAGMLLCAWLGAFTWEVLSQQQERGEAAKFCLAGGAGGLLTIAVLFAARLFQGPEALPAHWIIGTLYTLGVPLFWSILLMVAAFNIRPRDYPGHFPSGNSGHWPPPDDGPDAGIPARPVPPPPVRPAEEACNLPVA